VPRYQGKLAASRPRPGRARGAWRRGGPADLGVVGTDANPTGAYCDPPLTTVRFDLTQEATQIAQSVFLALGLDGEIPAEPANSPIQILHRAST
jgi:DNA-binding LacI/PurR family transcriptional regulator